MGSNIIEQLCKIIPQTGQKLKIPSVNLPTLGSGLAKHTRKKENNNWIPSAHFEGYLFA